MAESFRDQALSTAGPLVEWWGVLRVGRSDDHLERWEARTNVPLLILAGVMLPLIVLPLLSDLSHGIERAFTYGEWGIWAIFAVDLVVRLWLAENRRLFLRRNWIDVLIVVVPFLRPLRLLRAVVFVARIWALLDRRGVRGTVVLAIAVMFGATAAIWGAEHGQGGEVQSWDTALWWTLHTMATGDGVREATTVLGRIVGAIVTLLGFALLGMVTATIAAWFVEQGQDVEQEQILAELKTLQDEVKSLREEISREERVTD
ncbi:MAG: two pore domain potassium channel family protein [Chloroflexota bacterium]|nr:two pore domain potassium channel family protein [Chloroflexota bacterium]